MKFVVEVRDPVRIGHHGIALRNLDGQLMWAWAAEGVELSAGVHEFFYSFPALPLRPGPYTWHVSLYDGSELVDAWDCLPEMIIATEGFQHPRDEWNGVLNVPCNFLIREALKVGK